MKTTVFNPQTLNGKNLVLGLLATLFTSFTFANHIEQDQMADLKITDTTANAKVLEKQAINLEDEIRFMDSIASFTSEKQKEVVNTILANEQIIESSAAINPCIYLNKTNQEVISADNQIIESNLDNTTYPLDFNLINQSVHNKNADFKNRAFDRNDIKS